MTGDGAAAAAVLFDHVVVVDATAARARGAAHPARAAGAGMPGALRMLSGPVGFGAAMADRPDWSAALESLFVDFTIGATTFKRFSACGHTFAAVDAATALRQEHGLAASDIETVEIATYRKAVDVAGIATPKSDFEARFSIPFCVAAALTGHNLALAATYERYLDAPEINDLLVKISLAVDKQHDAAFPAKRGASATIVTRDGRRLERRVPTRKGDPANPLTEAELRTKFCGLIERTDLAGQEPMLLDWIAGLSDGSRRLRFPEPQHA